MYQHIDETHPTISKFTSEINNRGKELINTKCFGFLCNDFCHSLDKLHNTVLDLDDSMYDSASIVPAYICVPRASICNGRIENSGITNQESVDT